MGEHAINGLMGTTLEKIKEMVDSSTIIGDPIINGEITIIPVSKVVYGFASGGSDLPTKTPKQVFGGGSGAGVTIAPVAFLVVNGKDVRLLQIDSNPGTADKVIGMVPDLFDKISGLFTKKDKPSKDDSKIV
ncbi:MAG: GerW family sporulation protein [Oscillospiraceae bacterium]|jgi:sporulation protein YtfJ|nr:GerW family sporulation protein [Oscillospiraceae bacterium]